MMPSPVNSALVQQRDASFEFKISNLANQAGANNPILEQKILAILRRFQEDHNQISAVNSLYNVFFDKRIDLKDFRKNFSFQNKSRSIPLKR